jgi:hypothetical protein
VYVCIKPLFGESLSSKAKENIINNILKKHNVVTVDIEIVDPEYLYVDLGVTVRYNPVNTDITTGQIQTLVSSTIDNYNTNVLNRFGGFYSDVELMSRIKSSNSSILTSYSDITLEKRFAPALNSLETYYIKFLNQLEPGTVISDQFVFRLKKSYFADDEEGNLVAYYWDDLKNQYVIYPSETFGSVDYTTGQVRLSGLQIGSLYTSDGLLKVFATPSVPDFFTKQNNVVVIDDVQISVIEDFENENNKV